LRIAPGADLPAGPAPVGDWVHPDFDLDERGLITRLAFTPAKPEGPPIRLLAWQPEAGRVAFEAAAIAIGTGAPSFTLEASGDPLIEPSVDMTSIENGQTRVWERRADFDASRRPDAHFVVETEPGLITTGDGDHGRTAPAGSLVVVTGDGTRGSAGNVASGAIDAIANSTRNQAIYGHVIANNPVRRIRNPSPATGATDSETIRGAIARARVERESPHRAVTLDDHVALALRTPGARIARAEARANFHPGFPCLVAPGIVTVLILPHLPLGRPEPTDGLRALVAAWLHGHRVIGTRIEVAGPVYVPVSVRAVVGAQQNTDRDELATTLRDRIDAYFDPLTGGPDGTGWPFGRDVYRAEILQLIDAIPGVDHVRSLELIDVAGNASCGNLCIGPLGLPDAQQHVIEIQRERVR
jgi:predicted phage baseplate assembly protein